jgi:hypothetical protein
MGPLSEGGWPQREYWEVCHLKRFEMWKVVAVMKKRKAKRNTVLAVTAIWQAYT